MRGGIGVKVSKNGLRYAKFWVWLGATEGGLVAAGGMRLKPLAGQTLGFGYLFASHLLLE